jgi:transcriptional regulator with GAF, ATPase, and Fis domain
MARWQHPALHYAPPIAFPITVAVASAAAGGTHGTARVLWTLTAIAGTAGTAVVAVRKERQAAAAEANITTRLNEAGAPLLEALGTLTSARTDEARAAALDVLIHRAVDIAHQQCGRRSKRRAVLYTLNGDRLDRRAYAGRQSNAPRRLFHRPATAHDAEAIRLAHSEEVLIVNDLHTDPPPHFVDAKGRSYRSFIAVPIRAADAPYGLLTLDADRPDALTTADKGHLILIAGVLAAGFAHDAHHSSRQPCAQCAADSRT